MKYLWIALAGLFASAASAQNSTEQSPKTEVGLGLAVLQFPAYRGSNQSIYRLLPFPYLQYNGTFFKADRDGMRGNLFDSERMELSVSVSGSPPTKSDSIALRKGMADLRPSLELGPQLNMLLSSPQDKSTTLKLRLPIRQGITVEKSPHNVGMTFSPNLNLDVLNPWGIPGGNLGVVVGPIFTTKKQNANFYDVDAASATQLRPAYQSHGGYAGSQFLVSLSRKYPDFWIGSYIRYDNLQGATFANSPLVATKHYVTAGVAFSYIFAKL
jgi:MipA family protein